MECVILPKEPGDTAPKEFRLGYVAGKMGARRLVVIAENRGLDRWSAPPPEDATSLRTVPESDILHLFEVESGDEVDEAAIKKFIELCSEKLALVSEVADAALADTADQFAKLRRAAFEKRMVPEKG